MKVQIPEKLRRPIKWVGFPLFAVAVFNLSLYVTLPRDRIRERVEHVVGDALDMEVSAQDFGLSLLTGPGVSAGTLTLKTKPAAGSGEKPVTYEARDVAVRFDVLRLLRGFVGTSFRGSVGGGRIDGRYHSVPEESAVTVDATGVSLGAFPNLTMLFGASPVPLGGAIDLSVDLTLPKGLYSQAEGSMTLGCEGCVIGDGKAKLTVPGSLYLGTGLTLPRVKLGKITGSVVVAKGRATLRDFRAHSPDIDVEIEGYVDLRDPLPMSQVHLYLKVKPSDALLKREASLEAMVSVGASAAKRSDGFLGFSISGSVGNMMAMASREPPVGVGGHTAPTPSLPHLAPPAPSLPLAPGAGAAHVLPSPAAAAVDTSGAALPPQPHAFAPPPSEAAPPPVPAPAAAPTPPAQAAAANAVPPPAAVRSMSARHSVAAPAAPAAGDSPEGAAAGAGAAGEEGSAQPAGEGAPAANDHEGKAAE